MPSHSRPPHPVIWVGARRYHAFGRLGALGGVQCSYSGFCRFFLPFCCSGLRVSPVVMSSLNLFISPQLPSKNAADPTHARTPVLSAILHAHRNMRSVRRVFYQKTSHSLHAAPLLAAGCWCSWRSLNCSVITRVIAITRNYPAITQPKFRCWVIRRL